VSRGEQLLHHGGAARVGVKELLSASEVLDAHRKLRDGLPEGWGVGRL
jgi:hypothetical protein